MSAEWIQIIFAIVAGFSLAFLIGRYLMWRRWDKERRELRQARLVGLRLRSLRVDLRGQ